MTKKSLIIIIALTILLIIGVIYFIKTNSDTPQIKIESTGNIPAGGTEE